MKLTNRAIGRLWAALHQLDGQQKPDGTREEPYQFKGNVLYGIARTINHLRGHQEAVQKATDGIVRKHAKGKAGISADDPAFAACQDEINELLDVESEVEIHRVKLVDLNLEKNHLRPTTLAGLEAIIEE
jgi:hypothetical protein